MRCTLFFKCAHSKATNQYVVSTLSAFDISVLAAMHLSTNWRLRHAWWSLLMPSIHPTSSRHQGHWEDKGDFCSAPARAMHPQVRACNFLCQCKRRNFALPETTLCRKSQNTTHPFHIRLKCDRIKICEDENTPRTETVTHKRILDVTSSCESSSIQYSHSRRQNAFLPFSTSYMSSKFERSRRRR